MRLPALAALLALSGAAALIYEVAWARQLAVLLGGTADAASAAVAAMFTGLALGGWLGARLARTARPLLAYAACETVAAVWVLALPSLLASLDPTLASSPLSRTALAIALLLPATTALGATLPLIARLTDSPRATTWAYAANLAGAVLGTLLATFLLLRLVGVTATSRLGAAAALAAAAIAGWYARRIGVRAAGSVHATPQRLEWAYGLAAVSGIGTAAAQVLYTRALALTFHNSTYSFGAVVAAFLIALAAGAAIAARVSGREARAAAAVACAIAAAMVPVSIGVLWATTRLGYFSVPGGFVLYAIGALGLALLVIGPPVTAMAIALPAAWRGASGDHAAAVGRLTAINTLGAAAATVAAALLIVPALGPWGGLAAVSALYALAAVALRRARRLAALSCVVALAGALLARPAPPLRPGERMIAHWDTAYGWLDVTELGASRRMRLDIHYGLASTQELVRQRRMGHLPLLLHPAPRRALYLGLATGITAGAALAHRDVAEVDVVEFVPEIVEAAAYFADWNRGLLDDPRARVHVGDARHWLAGARGTWDVVVTDLLVPWEAGAGSLYTVEQHRAVAARLAEGGVYVQWLALWQVGERELGRVADATRAVFPHVVLWRGDTSRRWGTIAVVASRAPIALDGAALRARLDGLDPPLDRAWLDPAAIAALYVGDWPRRDVTLHSDDRPLLELEAPIAHRDGEVLIRARLVAFYRRVVRALPRAAVTYTPPPGAPAWDPAAGIELQMGAAGADGEPDDD
jgi:spermidine synthase